MSNEQMGDVFYFLFLLAGVVWRAYSSRKKNTPDVTRTRITNGHAKTAASAISTDELKRFFETSQTGDESRDAQLSSHARKLDLLTERYLNTQDKVIDIERRLFTMETSFQTTLQTLARIEASQSSINVLLTNLTAKGGIVQ